MDQDIPLEGFLACSTNEKRPLVILCHAWRGRDDFICEKAQKIGALGYTGFALDVYGKGILGNSKDENAALKKPFLEDRSLLQKRLLKGFEMACSLPYVDPKLIAVLGFGFGGLCALDLARSGLNLKGVVSIYGHFDPPHFPTQPIKSKVLILHGYNDPISTMEELHTFEKEMENAQIDWQSHIYGNTFHAFATPSTNDLAGGIVYNSISAERAWKAVENFLKEILS